MKSIWKLLKSRLDRSLEEARAPANGQKELSDGRPDSSDLTIKINHQLFDHFVTELVKSYLG